MVFLAAVFFAGAFLAGASWADGAADGSDAATGGAPWCDLDLLRPGTLEVTAPTAAAAWPTAVPTTF